MGHPYEFEHATDQFYKLLVDARDFASLSTTNQSYTMVQGVLQVFRRRLSVRDVIHFCQCLPAVAQAILIREWDVDEPIRPFGSLEEMNAEVHSLRPLHNFAPPDSIGPVAAALRKNVDPIRFEQTLSQLPAEAQAFWMTNTAAPQG